MLHRPVNGNSSSSVGILPRSTRSAMMTPPNENGHLRTSKAASMDLTTTSTPAKSASRTRRAFGDISNKKAAAPNGGVNGKNSSKGKSSSKSSSNAVMPPITKQFQSRIPRTAGSGAGSSKLQPPTGSSQRTHPWSKTLSQLNVGSSATRPSLSSHRQVDFILPSPSLSSIISQPKHEQHVDVVKQAATETMAPLQLATFTPATKVEPVDNVELPAGRLWNQQQQQMDDDDCSTSSMLDDERLDSRTMWDDWKESMQRQWNEERVRLELADDREVQTKLDRFDLLLQADDQGLECLFDAIDNALQLDQTIDLAIEDDEWSVPASSLDGTLGLLCET